MNGEEMKLEPCPNPWCTGKGRQHPCTWKGRGWRVMCACGIRTPRYDTRTEAIAAWNTRPPINRPSPEAGESGELVKELIGAATGISDDPADAPDHVDLFMRAELIITRLQAELAEARKERDDEKAARRSLSMLAADEVDTANALRDLLFRARWYVNDALDAHEHSDGRDLLKEIDAALRWTEEASQGEGE